MIELGVVWVRVAVAEDPKVGKEDDVGAIRDHRERVGFSATRLGAALGVSASLISQIETGTVPMSRRMTQGMARAFGVSEDHLLAAVLREQIQRTPERSEEGNLLRFIETDRGQARIREAMKVLLGLSAEPGIPRNLRSEARTFAEHFVRAMEAVGSGIVPSTVGGGAHG